MRKNEEFTNVIMRERGKLKERRKIRVNNKTESIIKTSKKNHPKRHCKVTEHNLIYVQMV